MSHSHCLCSLSLAGQNLRSQPGTTHTIHFHQTLAHCQGTHLHMSVFTHARRTAGRFAHTYAFYTCEGARVNLAFINHTGNRSWHGLATLKGAPLKDPYVRAGTALSLQPPW